MLRDVFYYGKKPNVHPRERHAQNLKDARKQSRTEHFWIINEYCDYKNFDWEFDFELLPDEDVWAEEHNNVWPSQHQKDSGTWLCNKKESDVIIYRNDVDVLKRKNEISDNWKLLENIDTTKWDFSWHPDPSAPPYIYQWGCKFFPVELKACLEYRVEGATQIKYMTTIVELLPETDRWVEHQPIDKSYFDMSWRPDPMDPPFIYVWGNKFVDGKLKPTLEYHTPGATDKKYMPELLKVLPEWDKWVEVQPVDKVRSEKEGFDFSWRPDPREPAYIYTWGNKYIEAELRPTLEYHCEGATERKYMGNTVSVLPEWDKWNVIHPIDKSKFDFSWRPDPREPNLIYVFGNKQHVGNIMPTIEYVMEDATERKYINDEGFRPPLLPDRTKFEHLEDSDGIDYSWRPDPTSPPYIYAWGNQWNKAEDKVSIQYVVPGATEYKYMEERSKRKPCLDNWLIPNNIDTTGFDFSWEPSPAEPPYIYQFGTQWQKDGGPQYVVKGATEIKYVEFQKVKALPTVDNWTVPKNVDVSGFDFSWHPDNISPPYIYVFATQWALTGGPVYTVPGATEKKYVEYPTAVALSDKSNWEIPESIDSENFDFSWHPFAEDDPCIYQIGTQWQKTGGPRYIVPGTDEMSPVKYIDRRIIKSKHLPDKSKFKILHPIIEEEFDFSWHPDTTEEPYIYVFGNQHYNAEKMPTVEYHVEGATQYKYVNDVKAKLAPSKQNWVINISMAESIWDFTWVPDPGEPPYIYVFGNQWHDAEIESTIEYHVPGATEKKYINEVKATVLADMTNWKFNYIVDKKKFDFSWRPDPGSPPYIYVFGSNLYPAEEMSTVEYHVPGATEYKYVSEIVAQLAEDKSNWVIPDNVDVSDFDFTWHPNPKDPAYIYYAGTQWQKTGGPKYVVQGATEIKYLENRKVKALPNKDKWVLPPNVDVSDFDFSWHPDDTEPPYIYQFGTQWALTGGPKYVMPDATEVKYMDNPIAKALPDKSNWIVPENIDSESFDFSWHPYVEDQPYIYQFGTQWQKTGGPRYVTPGADEMSPVKYIDRRILKSKRLPDRSNWEIPSNIDPNSVDYSWHPDDTEQPYIYEFGTQWHDRGGPKYVVPDATAMKYSSDIKGKLIKERDNWEILTPIVEEAFDFSWHPHPNDPPFIYVFGNNLYPAEEMETVRYVVEGATQVKYVNDVVATLAEDKTNWEVPEDVDTSKFDFTWKPHPKAPSYIYEFGTQWQKTGGPRYVVPGAKEVNYIPGSKAVYKPKTRSKYWEIPESLDISEFDFSWHPDKTDKAYIYQFGTQWAMSGGPRYVVPGATEIKYMDNPVAKMKPNKSNWEIPSDIDVDSFDFSWHPYIEDQAYIYQFGTQWQKTGGPRYITPGSDEMSPVKYIDRRILKAKKLPNKKNFTILGNSSISEFDYSWHPDDTEPPYIYIFGNDKFSAEIMPTVQYTVEGATTKKYVSDVKAKLGINMSNWKIPTNVDTKDFDFSWVPDPNDPPYIYEFGTQWQKTDGPQYIVSGAVEKKYVDGNKVTRLADKTKFQIMDGFTIVDFDFSWHPDSTEQPYIYVFGNQHHNAEITPTIRYVVEGATEIKYINEIKATIAGNKANWIVPDNLDVSKFDFSWIPNPYDPPYIYEFGTQWQKTGGPRYIVKGATELKYVDTSKAIAKSNVTDPNWNHVLPVSHFDYSWHPDSTEEPYIYVFGNSQYPAEIMPTVKYIVPGATKTKYVHDVVAKLKPSTTNWNELIPIDKTKFDFSWVPDPTSPPYIYVFGNQWNKAEVEPTIEYKVPGATEYKYVHDIVASTLPNKRNWKVNIPVDKSFDFTWRPNPKDPAYIYVFGNQWNKAEKESTVEYTVPGAIDRKYVQDIIANVAENLTYWKIPDGIDTSDFDFSWRPDSGAPPYIYQFGTLQNDNDGPAYHTPGNNGEVVRLQRVYKKTVDNQTSVGKYYITTTLSDLAEQHPDELFWALRENIDYTNFDFDWRPNIEQARYVHVFGSPDAEMTQTYFVSGSMWKEGFRDYNYVQQETKADSTYLAELFVQPDIFLVDRGNPETQARFEQLKARFTNVSKTRFLNSWVDTINRCINRSNTELCWILNSELDYSNFDFKYYPNPWQLKMVHVFGTQWSHWGTTFMVNRDTFTEDTKYIKIIEHLSNLNFVKDRRAIATNNLYDIIVINHGNKECDKVIASLEARACGKKVTTVDYDTSYVNTLKNIVNNLNAKKEQFVWITSSVCSYGEFDFTYICDPFARDSLHVFPSDRQKFGDTFLLDVNKAKEAFENIELLQQYPKVNYNQTIRAKRLSAPVIKTGQDTHVEAVKSDFDFPYAIFQTEDITTVDNEPMNLWAPDTKSILITSTGGTRIIVPKEAKEYVKDQLYDYPYIKTASKLLDSKPLDIVFLSNGEKCAEENYEHLLAVTKGLKNRVVRVDGVNGRVDAYHAAVKASQTNWTFTVFAKLKVDSKFDFNWQPDRLQMPKHYIFHAKNPVNGLEYGHQGMIAYNKALTLNNFGDGLDFTLDDPHETVEILSGVATFNTDNYSTWRTAFREVIKLKSDYTDISQERLEVWLTKAKGKYAKDCLQGANDAVEYYDQVNGDIDQLKLSYEWNWLLEYYNRKYK